MVKVMVKVVIAYTWPRRIAIVCPSISQSPAIVMFFRLPGAWPPQIPGQMPPQLQQMYVMALGRH